MKKAKFLLGIGVWVVILPHLGFPLQVKYVLSLLTGVLVVYIATLIYRQAKPKKTKEFGYENFTESNNIKLEEYEEN